MLPEAFIRRIKLQSYIDSEGLLNSINEPSPVSLRLNESKWTKKPFSGGQVPWCRSGYYLSGRPAYTLDPLFHAGCYYPQEASSMFLEQIFLRASADTENLRVLDLCGAPGGKSTHLASLIGNKGFLVSNEVIHQRAMVLNENLIKWGLSNAIVTRSDPSAFGRLPGFFDIIIIDAPCSGEGMFRNQVAVNEWSEENTALCSERQKRILIDAWPALKEDGTLIYSTCTFNPGENEKIIKWLVRNREAETIRQDISEYEGITEIDHEGIYGYGFYPGKIRGEGFFISALRKKSKNIFSPAGSKRDTEQKLTREEKSVSRVWTSFPEERLFRFGNDVIAAPCSAAELRLLSGTLKIVSAGTKIFSVRNKSFLPSHELAMSVWHKRDQFPLNEIELNNALSFLRRDNFSVRLAEKGWNLITYKGVNLGFVNNIGSRFNNYYPVEWRIRMDITKNGADNILKWE